MPRRATGSVLERKRKGGTVYALRFTLPDGSRQYRTLGGKAEGWTPKQADAELRHTLSDVERGIWKPPAEAVAPDSDPTFHEFASEWFESSKGEWREGTQLDYQWQLSHHLLPFFRDHRLSQITIAEVDRYRTLKVRQGGLSATTINKTITRLSQVLEVAVEYELIDRNTAKGKRRRLKGAKPAPVWLDSAEGIEALLQAAGDLDRTAHQPVPRRAILSTLVFAGLRISELIELRWRDVDLAAGKITVRASKTDAGRRTVDLLPVLHHELKTHRAGVTAAADDRVFPTLTGGAMNPSNVRNRILAKAVERANKRLAKTKAVPLPEGLSPHKLRHTFASLLVALGTDPGAVMDQLGHTDPGFTLRVYRHGMRRDDESKVQLATLVGVETDAKRHQKGTSGKNEGALASIEDNGHHAKVAG